MVEEQSISDSNSGVNDTVVGASSCAWKEVVESDSTCTLRSRTCYECLNKTPTNGKECVLTSYGLCLNIENYKPEQDYRNSQKISAGGVIYFPSANSTYCEATDASCSTCNDVVCIGTSGCVCVSACTDSTWELVTEKFLPSTMVAANETSICELADTSSTGTSDTSLSSTTTPSPTEKQSLAAEDACMWYQNQTTCGDPRTCHDCLNTRLLAGQECTITPSGYCATIQTYDYKQDFRTNNTSISGYYYPSTNTTYCNTSDAACRTCSELTTKEDSSQFCIGTSGCVCLTFCESPVWKDTVNELMCQYSVTTDSSSSSSNSAIILMRIPLGFIGVGAFLCIVLIVIICSIVYRKVYCTRQQRIARRRTASNPIGPSLELPVWKAMREQLIEKERMSTDEGIRYDQPSIRLSRDDRISLSTSAVRAGSQLYELQLLNEENQEDDDDDDDGEIRL